MKARLKITSVEVVKGVIYDNWMTRYSASGNVKTADPKALKIYGSVDGIGEVVFFTPTVVLVKSFGKHTEIHTVCNENNWFVQNENTDKSSEGIDGFIYVRRSIQLTPSVSPGDVVDISFSIKGKFGNKTGLNRVKLLAS